MQLDRMQSSVLVAATSAHTLPLEVSVGHPGNVAVELSSSGAVSTNAAPALVVGHHTRSISLSDRSRSSSGNAVGVLTRHNTLGAAPKLTKIERNRARIGLSTLLTGDQEFYIPTSPSSAATPGPWLSDVAVSSEERLSLSTTTNGNGNGYDGNGITNGVLTSSPGYSPLGESGSATHGSFMAIKGDRNDDLSKRKGSGGRPILISKNSLLDAGGDSHSNGSEREEWESSLMDERDRAAMDLRSSKNDKSGHESSPTRSTHTSSPVGRSESPSGRLLLTQRSTTFLLSQDGRLADDSVSDSRRRRGKSLNFCVGSSSPRATSSLGQPSRPAPLSFTTGSSHGTPSAPISPVGGSYSRSPWAPTEEEVKGLNSPGLKKMPSGGITTRSFGRSVAAGIAEEVVVGLSRDLAATDLGPVASSISSTSTAAIQPMSHSSPAFQIKRRLPPLMTSPEALASMSRSVSTSTAHPLHLPSFRTLQGPASAAPFVPPIGHSHAAPTNATSSLQSISEPYRPASAVISNRSSDWSSEKERIIGHHSNSAKGSSGTTEEAEGWPAPNGFVVGLAMQQQQQIQVLQSQTQQTMQTMEQLNSMTSPSLLSSSSSSLLQSTLPSASPAYAHSLPVPMLMSQESYEVGNAPSQLRKQQQQQYPRYHPLPEAALVVSDLPAPRAYNPTSFDLRPPGARFFVIKSYTEEDVHKSLKHEIWASTKLGNNRLDRAFRETTGPIYLFFSVNASGNFCGVAQMLSSVDYTTSSTVWASDKWKGIFSLRWIFVKDVPLANLRHIILNNTPENKPVTSSRDTQEVLYNEGCEVLQILSSYPSRTSLLQDSPTSSITSSFTPRQYQQPPQQQPYQHQHQQQYTVPHQQHHMQPPHSIQQQHQPYHQQTLNGYGGPRSRSYDYSAQQHQ